MDKKTAYEQNSGLRIFNVNDQITQTFEGAPLIIAASTDFQITSTLGVNIHNRFGNNFALYWNQETSSFENLYDESAQGLNISSAQLLKKFKNNNEVMAVFDLEKKEDFQFLAELEFLQNMVQQLQENEIYSQFTKDNIPDLFSFCFASLKALKQNSDSAKFSFAVQLIDQTLIQVYHKLSTIYDGKISLEVVFLGTPAFEKLAEDKELKTRLFSLLKDSVNKNIFDLYFPSIYLTTTSNQDLCQRVREEIENEVICTNHFSSVTSVKNYVRSITSVEQTDVLDDATAFQTVLWISIILFLAVIAASYSLFQMELPADSILYRTSAPKQHTS